jgi:phosphotransferase system enzyme I (PtsI)
MTMEKRFEGHPASPGIAMGSLVPMTSAAPVRVASGAADTEAAALRSAIAAALADLRQLADRSDDEGADILAFQVALLEDDELAAAAFAAIAQGRAAHDAWLEAMGAESANYKSSEEEYFRARAADIDDIGERVHRHLTGDSAEASVPPGAIVAAVDLTPSRFLSIDWSRGGALVLTAGSATSHVAMLARSRGVPAVVGLGVELAELRGQGLVDAFRGMLVVNPGAAACAQFAQDALNAAADRSANQAAATKRAVTADGTAIDILLNVADPAELDALDPSLCEGIGLVRTELLFHGRRGLPDEDQQYAAYRRIAEWARGRPVTIRTLDAGGDKPIPGLTLSGESNPFLGVRGLRLSLSRPEIFRVQLRAMARAAVHGDVKIMLPMVSLPRELAAARALLDAEVEALRAAGVPSRRPSLGIMVEVPAAAIMAELFDAEFFSIGSNDLAQYVSAAGRDVDALADLADPIQPAMLRLIAHVVDAAHARGIEVSLCGDAGGDPRAIPSLLRAGLRRLSMPAALVGAAKAAIAAVDLRVAGEGVP